MIVTKVEEIYEVTMPASVRQLLSFLSVGISLGLGPDSTSGVLTCLGLDGFERRLVAWIILPPILILLILIGSCFRLAYMRTFSGEALLTTALPLITRSLFFIYPLVSNVAFEAFSCHEFDDQTKAFLRADVAIACSSPWAPGVGYNEEHMRVTIIAFIAIGVYPLGVILLIAVLLFASRKAILSGKPTALSSASRFLYREDEPTFFWSAPQAWSARAHSRTWHMRC